MANFLKKALVLASFSLVISGVANANEYEQVNFLAAEIQSSADLLVNNTEPYRSTPDYTVLVDQCVRLQQGATELVNLVQHETDIYQIEAKISQLDKCFHQLPRLIFSTEFEASQGRGIVQGDTAPFKQLLGQTGHDINLLVETVTEIRFRVEQDDFHPHGVPGGEILIPIQPPVSKQHLGHSLHNNGLGVQFSFGGSFGDRPPVQAIQQQFIQQRNFNQQFAQQQRQADQRRQAEQQRRQVEQQRRQLDQQRQRQEDQRRQVDQQRRQADQRRQQEQQRRQADQQRQRQADQRRQADQQRRQADQRRQQEQQQRQAKQQRQRQAEQKRRQAEQRRRKK